MIRHLPAHPAFQKRWCFIAAPFLCPCFDVPRDKPFRDICSQHMAVYHIHLQQLTGCWMSHCPSQLSPLSSGSGKWAQTALHVPNAEPWSFASYQRRTISEPECYTIASLVYNSNKNLPASFHVVGAVGLGLDHGHASADKIHQQAAFEKRKAME